MSGSVRLCWRCGVNTWAGRGEGLDCVHCGAPEEPCCPECDGSPDERVMGGMKCGPCAYAGLVDEVYGDPDMAEQERSDAAAEVGELAGDLLESANH